METRKQKELHINEKLPQIILPKEKRDMFATWWNNDIRFEKEIPHTFSEGYLSIELPIPNIDSYKELIKTTASKLKTTYRKIENDLKNFFENTSILTVYFKFLANSKILTETYFKDKTFLCSEIFNAENDNGEINLYSDKDVQDVQSAVDYVGKENAKFLATCLWYMATTKNTTKYVYTKQKKVVVGRHKKQAVVSDTKVINTPIFDMNKIRVVKVDNLVAKKRGWTYSHSFQVHGHYRHYKSGKVIFVNSFIKGQDKEFKTQKIILNPN